ncbi:hypothetical protein NIES4071_105630 (plasmid) [Calothrix sp. NIES-4071]|nr:hypothetical protein NIES4071_105630 [Calothrix sp. NIES-4071]BAZ64981.1 hypothetical protein NIES4105_107140 [Calothrix sp. NIES-4105]
MGEIIDLSNSSKRNPFSKYKLWDVYSFSKKAIPSDCGSIGRVIEITYDYVVFGFRNITTRRLVVVNLHPRDIHAKLISDYYAQIRSRIFALMNKYSDVYPLMVTFEHALKFPDLTIEEVAFVDSVELHFDDNLRETKRSHFKVL